MSLDVYLQQGVACKNCGIINEDSGNELYWANITHNLNKMADKAGIYEVLWSPDELGITQAKQLIPLLEEGIKKLKARPAYFKKFNAPNGWGKYENLIEFTEKYLEACKKYPDSFIQISK